MRRWFAIGLMGIAAFGVATAPGLSADSAAATKDWHYEKGGKITGMKGQNLLLDVGTDAGVFVGSTGMVYRGSTEDFLTDSSNKKIRFEIVAASAKSSEARVFEGSFSPWSLLSNRRVVLRAKNDPKAAVAASSKPSSSTPTSASSTDFGAKPRASKDHTSQKWCKDASTCARFCSGSKANKSAVNAMIAKQGLAAPSSMVDPAVAIQPVLRELGCQPTAGADPRTASKPCGIEFLKAKSERAVLPGVVPGLAKAALEAKRRGYVLAVGSTYRSLEKQVDLMCRHLAAGEPPCGMEKTGLACPGPNVHTDGYAVDLHLRLNGKKVTPATGKAHKCESHTALVKKEKHLTALNDIMFAAGWWKFCQELWHFEYTENAYNRYRTRTY